MKSSNQQFVVCYHKVLYYYLQYLCSFPKLSTLVSKIHNCIYHYYAKWYNAHTISQLKTINTYTNLNEMGTDTELKPQANKISIFFQNETQVGKNIQLNKKTKLYKLKTLATTASYKTYRGNKEKSLKGSVFLKAQTILNIFEPLVISIIVVTELFYSQKIIKHFRPKPGGGKKNQIAPFKIFLYRRS